MNTVAREVFHLHLDLLDAPHAPPEVSTSTVPQPAAHVQQERINRILDRRHVCHVRIPRTEHPPGMQQCVTYLVWVCCNAYYLAFITAYKRSLGQGNVFTLVCHSVYRGVYRSMQWAEVVYPSIQWGRGCVSRGVCVWVQGGVHPLGRHPPGHSPL